jgi:hypothetical protein
LSDVQVEPLESDNPVASPRLSLGGRVSRDQRLAGNGVRRPEIESGMSRYLVDRLLANPKITVRGGTEVTRLDGDHVLESISLFGPAGEQHGSLGAHRDRRPGLMRSGPLYFSAPLVAASGADV